MKPPSLLQVSFRVPPAIALTAGGLAIVVIAFLDRWIEPNVSLGFLYLFPILVMARFLNRAEIAALAATCTTLREVYGPFPWDSSASPRILLALAAFWGTGLFVAELSRNRQLVVEHLRRMVEQVQLRQEAEQQLRAIIETSPAAVLTVDAEGKVLLANQSASRLLGFENERLEGRSILPYLPVFEHLLRSDGESNRYRAVVESKGVGRSGEVFLARIWFSGYQTPAGPAVAAIVSDVSEDLREREERGLATALSTSRIMQAAVSHEIRNLSAAAAAVYANLARASGLAGNGEYKALGTLVEGLKRMTSAAKPALSQDCARGAVGLYDVLDDLRIVIEASFRESETGIRWEIPEGLPAVRGDHHRLLQVFLNLAQNSHRAMQGLPRKQLTVAAAAERDWIIVRFQDTGPGPRNPEGLFEPFQPGADGSGIGLYLSRAMIGACGGDLRYEPQPAGSCFAVYLVSCSRPSERKTHEQCASRQDQDSSDRRPHLVAG